MKSKLLRILSLICIFCFCSCSQSNIKPQQDKASKSSAPLRILVSNFDINNFKSLILNYNKLGNTQKFELEAYPHSEDEWENNAAIKSLQNEIMSGAGPDLYFLDTATAQTLFGDIGKAQTQGVFCDINEYINKDIFYDNPDIYTNVINSTLSDGKRFLVPLAFDMYYAVGSAESMQLINYDKSDMPSQFMNKITSVFDIDDNPWLNHISNTLLQLRGTPLFDYENAKPNFDEEFKASVISSQKIHDEVFGRPNIDESGVDIFGDKKICFIKSTYTSHILVNDKILKSPNELKFLPFPNGSGGTNAVILSFAAVSKSSQLKKEAVDFIQDALLSPSLNSHLLGKDIVLPLVGSNIGIPVCKGFLPSTIAAMEPKYLHVPNATIPVEIKKLSQPIEEMINEINFSFFHMSFTPLSDIIIKLFNNEDDPIDTKIEKARRECEIYLSE